MSVERDRELTREIEENEQLRMGYSLANDLPAMLRKWPGDEPDKRWVSRRQTEQEARESVRVYARWLLRVADEG